jgi:hypothetical protein
MLIIEEAPPANTHMWKDYCVLNSLLFQWSFQRNCYTNFQVLWPAFNISSDDVMVTLVGKTSSSCNDVILTTSDLSCTPPPVDKQVVRYGSEEDKAPLVKVVSS